MKKRIEAEAVTPESVLLGLFHYNTFTSKPPAQQVPFIISTLKMNGFEIRRITP